MLERATLPIMKNITFQILMIYMIDDSVEKIYLPLILHLQQRRTAPTPCKKLRCKSSCKKYLIGQKIPRIFHEDLLEENRITSSVLLTLSRFFTFTYFYIYIFSPIQLLKPVYFQQSAKEFVTNYNYLFKFDCFMCFTCYVLPKILF